MLTLDMMYSARLLQRQVDNADTGYDMRARLLYRQLDNADTGYDVQC